MYQEIKERVYQANLELVNDNKEWPQTVDGAEIHLWSYDGTWKPLKTGLLDKPYSWQASTPTPGY